MILARPTLPQRSAPAYVGDTFETKRFRINRCRLKEELKSVGRPQTVCGRPSGPSDWVVRPVVGRLGLIVGLRPETYRLARIAIERFSLDNKAVPRDRPTASARGVRMYIRFGFLRSRLYLYTSVLHFIVNISSHNSIQREYNATTFDTLGSIPHFDENPLISIGPDTDKSKTHKIKPIIETLKKRFSIYRTFETV